MSGFGIRVLSRLKGIRHGLAVVKNSNPDTQLNEFTFYKRLSIMSVINTPQILILQ